MIFMALRWVGYDEMYIFGKYLYFSCVFLASSIKMSYIWSVQFINFKSCARHGFRDKSMFKLLKIWLCILAFNCVSNNCIAQIKINSAYSIDFGKVLLTGEAIEKEIEYENIGSNAVSIEKIIANVGTVSVDFSKKTLMPKDKAVFTIKLKPGYGVFIGKHRVMLTIMTSDKQFKRLQVLYYMSDEIAPREKRGDIYLTYVNGKYGIEDLNGKKIIDNKYKTINIMHDYYCCRTANNYEVLDKNGKLCYSFIADYYSFIPEGNVMIRRKGEYDAIYSLDGKCIEPFSKKLRIKQSSITNDAYFGKYIKAYTDDNFGVIINCKGKEVFRFKYPQIGGVEIEKDFTPFYIDGRFFVVVDGCNFSRIIKHYFALNIFIDITGQVAQTLLSTGFVCMDPFTRKLSTYCILENGKPKQYNLSTFSLEKFYEDEKNLYTKQPIYTALDIGALQKSSNPLLK